MDKQLLDALSNLSVSLEMIAQSLNKSREDAKSATANALHSGNFSLQIQEISKGIESIKSDTEKILDNQQTIIKLQKEKRDKNFLAFEGSGEKKKTLKDGISVVLLIASAVLAIGFAFKLLGDVDWKSVMSISKALPLMAYAFERVAKTEGLSVSKVFMVGLVLIGMSAAIMVSSYILSRVTPIGLLQSMSVVFIASAFGVVAFGLGNLLKAFKDISIANAIKGALVLPIVLIAVSTAITVSSWILQKVQPIGLFQALTAVMISAAFAVMSFGLGKLLSSFKNVSPSAAIAASIVMPIILVALSWSISKSSQYLQGVVPISPFQALTSILIAGVFVILGYAVKPLLQGLSGASLKEMASGVLILVALSAAITGVSWIIQGVAPVTFGSILKFVAVGLSSSLVVVAMALAIKSVNLLGSVADYIKGGLSILAISSTIMLSSLILNLGDYTKYPSIGWSLGAGLSLAAFGLGAVLLGTQALNPFFYAGLGVTLLVAGTVVAASHILGIGKYDKYPPLGWTLGVGLSLSSFGLASVVLGGVIMTGIGAVALVAGVAAILGIAATVVEVSSILSKGNFSKHPPLAWSMAVGSSLYAFATSVVMLGVVNSVGGVAQTLSLGVIKNPIDAGIGAVLKIAHVIPVVDKILSSGSYSKYPPLTWAMGVGASLTAFASGAVLMGSVMKFGSKVITNGTQSIKNIAQSIVDVSFILKSGSYSGGPSKAWVEGISLSLGAFSPVYKMLMANNILKIFGGGVSAEQFSKAIRTISLGIIDSGKIFSESSSSFNITKAPSKAWAEGVGGSISAFAPIFKFLGTSSIFRGSIKSLSSSIVSISSAISKSSKIFASGNYSIFPKKEWVDGTIYAIQKFKDIQRMLSFGDMFSKLGITNDPLQRAVSNVTILAIAFSKLGTAVKSFTQSIDGINAEKLGLVEGMTSNVVLLSLMDPDMFNDMMDRLEDRSGVFADLLKDFTDKKEEKSTTNGIRTKSAVVQGKSDSQVLGEKVDKMTAILYDISSVVGSRGALKVYLSSIKEVQLTGSSNSPSSSRR